METKIVSKRTDVMGGTPVFYGSRVPIKHLFDYIEGGETLESFLADYPTVERDQVMQLIETAYQLLTNEVVDHENPA